MSYEGLPEYYLASFTSYFQNIPHQKANWKGIFNSPYQEKFESRIYFNKVF